MNAEPKTECYKFEAFESTAPSPTPIWENTIDATYVICLAGNDKRYQQVVDQLKQVRPTKTVWIVHNTPYTKCEKAAHVTSSPKDITDANLRVFEHANEAGYAAILVLEDDFLFDARMAEPGPETQEIRDFVGGFAASPLLYYLGTLPLIQCPIGMNHNMVLVSCGTHGVIYNRAFRNVILGIPETTIDDWDLYMTRFLGWRYTYRIPLCYQLFPYTKNSTQWGGESWLVRILGVQFHDFNTVVLGLDRKIEPGYSFYNMISKLLFFIGLLVAILLVWFMVKRFSEMISVIPRRRGK